MKNEILKKKLMLLHHIATLSPDSIAFQVYWVQKRLELPGLLQECQEFLLEFEILDVTQYSKGQWKSIVKKNIRIRNKDDLLEIMKEKNYSKINHKVLAQENFELKSYIVKMHTSEARDKFRLRSCTMRTVKMNFPSDKQYKADLWSCWHCPNIDSQTHIQVCPAYQQFRDNKDLDNDHDLVSYFRAVIKLRDDMTSKQ